MKNIKLDLLALIIVPICTIINIVILYNKEFKSKEKYRVTLNYYESVETLLDSLCIDCEDTIFETDAGAKYLESKYKFDSLFIDNNYDRRN